MQDVIVRSTKYDGSLHRSWHAQLHQHTDASIILSGVFDEDVNHPYLGKIKRGTLSTEYYWTECWYSIFRFEYPLGHLRNYYCNINQPISFADNILTFVDLDVDIVVNSDGAVKVLDEDEFSIHSKLFGYPSIIHDKVAETVLLLSTMIDNRVFPFDSLVDLTAQRKN